MSDHQNAGWNHNLQNVDKSFADLGEFKISGNISKVKVKVRSVCLNKYHFVKMFVLLN